PQVIQPTIDDRHAAKAEVVKESSPTSVFVNSEPIREEQVQNAVKFLSHPKVRGSPVMYRRSFLERKGLTKEEMDEAFRRVPDPTPTATTTEPVVTNQVVPVGCISKMGTVFQFHWSHGLLAVSGAGTIVLFKSWIRMVVSEEEEDLLKKNNGKPNIVEEAAAAAKAASAAAADVSQASQQMLTTKSEEKKFFEELISMLNAQVNEMKSICNSIQKLEGGQSISGRIAAEQRMPWEVSQAQVSLTNILLTRGNQLSVDDAVPWWQRKNRSWVPPLPPPVALPEAAAAIRQPKKPSYQKEQMTDDQLLSRSPNVTDDLQRITKISESGGTMEVNGETSGLYSAEIQKEENGLHLET
ncbi:hypothetical protein Pfo_020748, partial [Paulownia fortunei]